MQHPTCPKHMLLKPCMHCEPGAGSKYGPPLRGVKIRRKAPNLRDGDRIYQPFGHKEFVGTVRGDPKKHLRYDDWFRFDIVKPDGSVTTDYPATPNEEFDVES